MQVKAPLSLNWKACLQLIGVIVSIGGGLGDDPPVPPPSLGFFFLVIYCSNIFSMIQMQHRSKSLSSFQLLDLDMVIAVTPQSLQMTVTIALIPWSSLVIFAPLLRSLKVHTKHTDKIAFTVQFVFMFAQFHPSSPSSPLSSLGTCLGPLTRLQRCSKKQRLETIETGSR